MILAAAILKEMKSLTEKIDFQVYYQIRQQSERQAGLPQVEWRVEDQLMLQVGDQVMQQIGDQVEWQLLHGKFNFNPR